MWRSRCRSRPALSRSIPIWRQHRRRPRPRQGRRCTPTWVSFDDDRVFYAYDSLPKGNYTFVFRTPRADRGQFHAAARRSRDDVSGRDLWRQRRTTHRHYALNEAGCWRRTAAVGFRVCSVRGFVSAFIKEVADAHAPHRAAADADRSTIGRASFSPRSATRGPMRAGGAADRIMAIGRSHELPDRVTRATLALEDRRFWDHPGVDPAALLRAALATIMRGNRRSGASTHRDAGRAHAASGAAQPDGKGL